MLKRYYQLTKPGIIYGNLLNTAAGFLLASKWHFGFRLLVAALGGTALVIASACVFNNYIDRGIDAKMTRTKKRALVSGAVSAQNALTYAVMLGALGFTVLIIYTNALTVYLGLLAMFTYIVLYGISKRRSVHGTVVGSIAGALPPVAGYTAVTNRLDSGAILLFLILVCWQMPHFYAIAMYRFKDYKAAGLPVLPVKHGMRAAKLQIVLYILAFIVATTALSVSGYTGYTFAIVMGGAGAYWLSKGLKGFRTPDDAKWARGMFGISLLVIMTLAFMLSVGPILP